jgi:hypothetical protein
MLGYNSDGRDAPAGRLVHHAPVISRCSTTCNVPRPSDHLLRLHVVMQHSD